jgi:hypothetical protein
MPANLAPGQWLGQMERRVSSGTSSDQPNAREVAFGGIRWGSVSSPGCQPAKGSSR